MRIFNLFLLCSLMACGNSNKLTAVTTAQNVLPASELVFVTMHIQQDTFIHKTTIKLLSQQTVAGKIKIENETLPSTPNYLTIRYFSKDKLLSTFVKPHPLIKRVEFDKNGSLGTKTIKVLEEDFFVRIPKNGTTIN